MTTTDVATVDPIDGLDLFECYLRCGETLPALLELLGEAVPEGAYEGYRLVEARESGALHFARASDAGCQLVVSLGEEGLSLVPAAVPLYAVWRTYADRRVAYHTFPAAMTAGDVRQALGAGAEADGIGDLGSPISMDLARLGLTTNPRPE